MTLQPYEPAKLDQFALQLLDLAAILRDMANRSREHGITDLALHDKKAQQWYDQLEDRWIRDRLPESSVHQAHIQWPQYLDLDRSIPGYSRTAAWGRLLCSRCCRCP